MTIPDNYIDTQHTDDDRKLLEVFYRATLDEGGTADERILRGIKAVLERQQHQPIPVSERLPEGLFPVEYWDMDSGARIVSEPFEEAPRGRGPWVVLNSRTVNPCTEFPTVQAAWDALHAHALPLPSGEVKA